MASDDNLTAPQLPGEDINHFSRCFVPDASQPRRKFFIKNAENLFQNGRLNGRR
jgi:hypothetical protein